MPIQHPHQVPSQEFQNPDSHPICAHAIIRNEPNSPKPTANRQMPTATTRNEPNPTCDHHPNNQKMRNEPNLRLPQLGPPSKYAKRTQSPHTKCPPNPDFCETNPISSRSTTRIRETNPIYSLATRPYSQMRKTNPARTPIMRNKPNPRRRRFRTSYPRPHRPNYAKRTQFPTADYSLNTISTKKEPNLNKSK